MSMDFGYNGGTSADGSTPPVVNDNKDTVTDLDNNKVVDNKNGEDINNIDSINANSVVGTIYLVIAGVIENITVDLIALPQGTDLSQY